MESFVGTAQHLRNKEKCEKFEGLHYIMPIFSAQFLTHFFGNIASSFIRCQHEVKATG